MRVSRTDWARFVRRLAAINKMAGAAMTEWMQEHPTAKDRELVAAGFSIATKYGESAASLTCLMYDAIAAAEGVTLPAAEPAATATIEEASKAIRGTLRNQQSTVPATVSRLVKQAGADTMLKNAMRDRAQFAWIPSGDSCPFCIMLASNGWQYISAKALRNGHAEHIHANCNCEYAVRHDRRSGVEGYEPEKYLEAYDGAEGTRWQDKVRALRREQYKAKADEINQQKRIAYAKRKEREGQGET